MVGADWGTADEAEKLTKLSFPLFCPSLSEASPDVSFVSDKRNYKASSRSISMVIWRRKWDSQAAAVKSLQFLKRFGIQPQLRERTLLGSKCLQKSPNKQNNKRYFQDQPQHGSYWGKIGKIFSNYVVGEILPPVSLLSGWSRWSSQKSNYQQ